MLWLLVACRAPVEIPVEVPTEPEVVIYDEVGCVTSRQRDFDLDGEIDLYQEDVYDPDGRLIRQDERRKYQYFSFWHRSYPEAGCWTTTETELHTDGGAFTGEIHELTCDEQGNPIREHQVHPIGTWGVEGLELEDLPAENTLLWENTYEGGLLTHVHEGGIDERDREVDVDTTRRYDDVGREVWRERVSGNRVDRVETAWHDDQTFREQLQFRNGTLQRTELQEIDEHGRVTRLERYNGNDSLIATWERTWLGSARVPSWQGIDSDGDGELDGEANATCMGEPSERCETLYEGEGWSFFVSDTLGRLTGGLLEQGWVCVD